MNPIVSAGGLSSGLEGSRDCELFSGDPRDPSGRLARPTFGLCPVPQESPRIDIQGASGRRETLEFQLEFMLPCGIGEGISWAGASGVHEGRGNWVVIAPGAPAETYWLGEVRSQVVFEFVQLVRSMWSIREHALESLIQGSAIVNDLAREDAP